MSFNYIIIYKNIPISFHHSCLHPYRNIIIIHAKLHSPSVTYHLSNTVSHRSISIHSLSFRHIHIQSSTLTYTNPILVISISQIFTIINHNLKHQIQTQSIVQFNHSHHPISKHMHSHPQLCVIQYKVIHHHPIKVSYQSSYEHII